MSHATPGGEWRTDEHYSSSFDPLLSCGWGPGWFFSIGSAISSRNDNSIYRLATAPTKKTDGCFLASFPLASRLNAPTKSGDSLRILTRSGGCARRSAANWQGFDSLQFCELLLWKPVCTCFILGLAGKERILWLISERLHAVISPITCR